MSASRLGALVLIGGTVLGCRNSGEPRRESGAQPAPAPDARTLAARLSPGAHHRHLDALLGRWESVVTVWPQPGAEANGSGGTSELEWILNGHWLRLDYRASDSGQGGVRGLGLIGYDNVREEHVFNWLDNVSCSALQSSGPCTDGGRTTALAGTHDDPASGERNHPFRWVIRVGDPGNWTLELYDTARSGAEFRKIRIVNSRRKGPAAAVDQAGL
jgi:hypothetical protein